MNPLTQDVLEFRQLRSSLTNQLIQATSQHKGLVLELRDTDSNNTEICDFIRASMKYCVAAIMNVKKELQRVDNMLTALCKGEV